MSSEDFRYQPAFPTLGEKKNYRVRLEVTVLSKLSAKTISKRTRIGFHINDHQEFIPSDECMGKLDIEKFSVTRERNKEGSQSDETGEDDKSKDKRRQYVIEIDFTFESTHPQQYLVEKIGLDFGEPETDDDDADREEEIELSYHRNFVVEEK